MAGYQTNPVTGERELVVEITRGNEPARPRWLMLALWVAALVIVYKQAQK